MHILVWGATPLAGWLAARLHNQEHTVRWLTGESIKEEIERFGLLEIRSPNHPPLKVTDLALETSAEACLKPPIDLIIFAMPGWAVGQAAMEIARYIPPKHYPPILAFVHGMGVIEKINGMLRENHAIHAVITRHFEWVMLPEEGIIQPAYETIVSDGSGDIVLARHPELTTVLPLLRQLGFEPDITDSQQLVWSDIFWQIQANALPALLDIPPHKIYDDPRLFTIEVSQIKEAIRIIDETGVKLIQLPGINVSRLAQQVRWLPPPLLAPVLKPNAHTPSLHDDLRLKTGRSDAAYLHGMIARTASDQGLTAPINHVLAIALTDIAEGRAHWSQFRNNIEHLETYIRVALPVHLPTKTGARFPRKR